MGIHLRVLGDSDREPLIRFLAQDRLLHLFLLAQLEAGKIDGPILRFWGAERNGQFVGAMMQYGANFVPSLSPLDCAEAFAEVIDADDDVRCLNGPPDITEAVFRRLTRYTSYLSHTDVYSALHRLTIDRSTLRPAKRATLEDVESLFGLYGIEQAGEMHRPKDALARHIRQRVWFSEDATGRAVSGCMTLVETHDYGLIGGVYTAPDARNRGWATACMAGMCEELLREGKRPCLFYDDPAAAAVYHKLGFVPFGEWLLLRMEKAL